MTNRDETPDLSALRDRYEIDAETRGSGETTTYLARRKSDGRDVTIRIARLEKGGENNALSHYAADAKLLEHPENANVIPVFEAHWLGDACDTLAVVSPRVSGETLDQALARGERFTSPRIAAMLESIDGALDWARDAGVVHRGVSADDVILEPGSERVLVSFAPVSIPIDGVPGADADARTIANLAWATLTNEPRGTPQLAEGDAPSPLAERRPDLATRVVAETEKLMRSTRGERSEAADVAAFIGVIAMADALKVGEDTVAGLERDHRDQQQKERDAWAEELAACRRTAADEAQKLADDRAAWERKAAEDRAAYEKAMSGERERFAAAMAAERAALQKSFNEQKAQLEKHYADERASMEKAVNDERAKLEREAKLQRDELNAARARLKADRLKIDKARAELAELADRQAATYDAAAIAEHADSDELDDLEVSPLAAGGVSDQDESQVWAPNPGAVDSLELPPPGEIEAGWTPSALADVAAMDGAGDADGDGVDDDAPVPASTRERTTESGRRLPRWALPTGGIIAGLLLIGGVAAAARLSHRGTESAPVGSTTLRTTPGVASSQTLPTGTAAGTLDSTMARPDSAAHDSVAAAAATAARSAPDSATKANGAAPDSAALARARQERLAKARAARQDSITRAEAAAAERAAAIARGATDSAPPARDTTVTRPASGVKPDSTRPDTTKHPKARPDSGAPPDATAVY